MAQGSGDDARFRTRLVDERERLLGLIRSQAGDVALVKDEDDEDTAESSDRADTARNIVELEQQQQVLEQLRRELEEVDAALERLDAGTYGIDEVTGEPIDPARLEAVPTARTNVGTEAR